MNARSRPADVGTANGFTIVEVLVAVTVLVIAMLGAALLFENAIVTSGNTRNRIVAANLATQQMETVRGMAADPTKFASIPQNQTVYATTDQKVGNIQFTVTQDVSFVGTSSTTSSCDTPGPTSGQVVQVAESVTWPGMGGTQPVRSVTTLSPPVGVYSATAGAIGVKVTDASSNPADNVAVQVTGGPTSVPPGQTTAEGCAYFFPLDPGTYTVTIVEGTGVGDQEVVAPVQTASVSVAQTTALQFQYDSPATIVATVSSPTNTPGAPPYATGMSLSVANTGVQLYGHFSFTESTTSDVTTSPSLFPYSSGYVVFAGNCTDNNPLGKDNSRNPYYPTSAPVPVPVTPGGSSTATVPLYPLTAHVQLGAGTAVAAATMTSTETSYAPPYTAVCLNGTATTTVPTLGLVTTNATGDSITAMPLGHWTINATSGPKRGTVNVWIKPDGVYAVTGTGAAGAKYPGPVVVVVS